MVVVAGSLALASIYPVYFRTDDVHYLSWASSHDDPLDSFRPSEGELFGVVRPVHLLAWWGLYRLFGLNAWGYQVFLGLAYGLSFVLLFMFVRRAISHGAALLSLAAYAAMFISLTHVLFWFSDLTLELLFANLSLYLLAGGVRGRPALVFWGLVSYVAAGLSKEPAIVVVPAVTATYVWVERRRAGPRWAALALLALGLLWAFASPYVRGRQGVPLDAGAGRVFQFIAVRWSYYGGVLMSGASLLAIASTVFLAVRSVGRPTEEVRRFIRQTGLPAVAALAAVALAAANEEAAMAVLILALGLVVARRLRSSPAAAWGAVPLLAVMTAEPSYSVYLTEASAGLSVVAGAALRRFARDMLVLLRGLPPLAKKVSTLVLIVAAASAVLASVPRLRSAEAAVRAVSETRLGFAEAVGYIGDNLAGEPGYLLVVAYDDVGIRSTDALQAMPSVVRARRQKTMIRNEVEAFLKLLGAGALDVRHLDWYVEHPGADPVYALTMNREETRHLESLPFDLELLHATSAGAGGARVYRIQGPQAG